MRMASHARRSAYPLTEALLVTEGKVAGLASGPSGLGGSVFALRGQHWSLTTFCVGGHSRSLWCALRCCRVAVYAKGVVE